jgi:hypothetical protein
MAIRTTVDIPEPLHAFLRHKAEESGESIRSLIVRAIEHAYRNPGKRGRLGGPPVKGSGKLGPSFPHDENPHDVVFP